MTADVRQTKMSRFKTGNRIEDAIKHRDRRELAWALAYAQGRLKTAAMKQHKSTWRLTIKRVQEALDGLRDEKKPNQALQRTIMAVTDRAPSSTLRASHSRL